MFLRIRSKTPQTQVKRLKRSIEELKRIEEDSMLDANSRRRGSRAVCSNFPTSQYRGASGTSSGSSALSVKGSPTALKYDCMRNFFATFRGKKSRHAVLLARAVEGDSISRQHSPTKPPHREETAPAPCLAPHTTTASGSTTSAVFQSDCSVDEQAQLHDRATGHDHGDVHKELRCVADGPLEEIGALERVPRGRRHGVLGTEDGDELVHVFSSTCAYSGGVAAAQAGLKRGERACGCCRSNGRLESEQASLQLGNVGTGSSEVNGGSAQSWQGRGGRPMDWEVRD
jgi:hypothetical protein